MNKAWLLASGAAHARDWLLGPPIAAIGLRIDGKTIGVAVGHRLGLKTREPHLGQECQRKRTSWLRLLQECKIPTMTRATQITSFFHLKSSLKSWCTIKEPTVILYEDGRRLTGVSLIPWSK